MNAIELIDSFSEFKELKNIDLAPKQMGKGRNYYTGTPKKDWKYYKQGTSAHLLNKMLCERVYNN